MTPTTLLLLATGVSADAFAVALGKGLQLRSQVVARALLIGVLFGGAQAVMPFLGWLLGSTFAVLIAPFDHWVAFGLLAAVGGKMLWEALHLDADEAEESVDEVSVRELLVLAVATSIDALAVGVSFAFLDIGVSGGGAGDRADDLRLVVLGSVAGAPGWHSLQRPAEIIGGVVLILIGAQIVAQHLSLI